MKIALDHVTKHYPDFDLDVTMEVPDDTITALIGTNGSGKTTTFRLMLGLARPAGGEGIILGDPIRRVWVNAKSRTGVTFGDSTFVPTFTLNDEIAERKRFYTTFDEQWCRAQLQRFTLPLNQQIQEFSAGMLAECKTIMAMAHHPEPLILDEPTAGLDVIARNEVLDLLREYMEIPGRSMLISSHVATDLEHLCDDLYLIDRGRIRMHETIDALHDEYAVLTLTDDQMSAADPRYILVKQRTAGGWKAITDERGFYEENLPGVGICGASIDEIITLMSADPRTTTMQERTMQ